MTLAQDVDGCCTSNADSLATWLGIGSVTQCCGPLHGELRSWSNAGSGREVSQAAEVRFLCLADYSWQQR